MIQIRRKVKYAWVEWDFRNEEGVLFDPDPIFVAYRQRLKQRGQSLKAIRAGWGGYAGGMHVYRADADAISEEIRQAYSECMRLAGPASDSTV